jgi:ubiquinone/menaquinone biosynthesis C-methylase UbiE
VAFGLRNMTHKDRALAEMARVRAPGGRVIVLEFSRPWKPLAGAYDAVLVQHPAAASASTVRADSRRPYRYLAESIRHAPRPGTLKAMMNDPPGPRARVQTTSTSPRAWSRCPAGYKLMSALSATGGARG